MSFSFESLRSPRKVALAIFVGVYSLLWLGGVGQHLFGDPVRQEHDWIASLFLLLAGLIVLSGARSAGEVVSFLGVAAFGFVIEVIGVRSGLPFGSYIYTTVLQPQVCGVPVVMAFAWMVLVAGIKQTLQGFGLARWLEVLLAALWMTAIDLVIDPLAANLLGYWHWRSKGNYYGIPATNFAGWFLSSLLVFAVLSVGWGRNTWSRWLSLSIVMFFTLIALAQQLFVLSFIGFALSVMQILFWQKLRRKEIGPAGPPRVMPDY